MSSRPGAPWHPDQPRCSLRLFSFEYPPRVGGIGRLFHELGRSLASLGHDVTVVTEHANGRPGITAVGGGRPQREIRALAHLFRVPRHTIVCAVWYPEGLLSLMARQRPLVVFAHGAELFPTPARWRREIWRHLRRRVLEAADLVIGDSRFSTELVKQAAPRARVEALPLGVDATRFRPGERAAARVHLGITTSRVITTVSRVERFKGHEVVLKALASLPQEVQRQITYVVAGAGPHLAALKRQSEHLGIANQVRWLGRVPDTELPLVYQASDVFVLCTRESPSIPAVEGFGLVFLEAQACGIPVIGTRSGGIPDAVREGDGGWLIDEDDNDAVRHHLEKVVHRPEVFRTAGIAARVRVERECTWDHFVRRFLALLDKHRVGVDHATR